jgi:AraC family transcriptional regulator
LQKLFRLALNLSIKEYISKRRISLAAEDILSTEMSITDIAYKYQFSSPEVFCRAFKKVWTVSPTVYKKQWKFSGIFPKIHYDYIEGEDQEVARKKVDIADAYDVFKSMKGTFVICFDIVNLTFINSISRAAGDLAIVESARRIDEVKDDDMLMFRIGADEFALVTGLKDLQNTEKLAEKVLSSNGRVIEYNDQKIPLSLRAGYTKIPNEPLRYSDFFTNMHQAIEESKKVEHR